MKYLRCTLEHKGKPVDVLISADGKSINITTTAGEEAIVELSVPGHLVMHRLILGSAAKRSKKKVEAPDAEPDEDPVRPA